ncbi:MAG: S8 family serine peptidase [Nodosilinea sp.]
MNFMLEYNDITPTSGSLDASAITSFGGTGLNDNILLNLPTPSLSGLADLQLLSPGLAIADATGLDVATELVISADVVLAAALVEAANDLALAPTSAAKADDLLGLTLDQSLVATSPGVTPQNDSLSTAENIGVLVGGRAFGGSVSASDTRDYFKFQLDARSDINLMLSGLSADADLFLIWDANGNGIVNSGEVLDSSTGEGDNVEAITFNNLLAGEYYIAVDRYSGSTNYNLYTAASPDGGIDVEQGDLRANSFSFAGRNTYTVVSGNGNVDFGAGYSDVLDLSSITSRSVTSWNRATASGGGVIYDPGNGGRVFDALSLSSGHQFLMEGLDGIRFSDGFLNLNSGNLPNDPLFGEQWNLHMMGVHQAWRFTQGSDAVVMGIADSGLGISRNGSLHPDFDRARTYGYGNNMEDDFLDDNTSHGTAVYGIMAAAGNNGIGLSGINWQSDVLNIDVFGPDDLGLDQATALMTDYAQSTGRRLVVNMSLSVPGADAGDLPGLEQLIAQNRDNALFVFSSSNDGEGAVAYPSLLSRTYDNVMSIGASWGTNDADGNPTEPGDRISYSNYGYGLSLMGPSEVITTLAGQTSSGVGFGYYLNAPEGNPFNGTSAAAPNVSGVASLVWSANPNLSAGQVQSIMQQTAIDLGFPGYDLEYGAGMVNADAAVRRAMALAGTPLRGSSAQSTLALPVVTSDAMTLALPVPLAAMASAQFADSGIPVIGALVNATVAAVQANPYLAIGEVLTRGYQGNSDPEAAFEVAAIPNPVNGLGESVLTATETVAELTLASVAEVGFEVADMLGAPQYDAPWELEALTQNLLAA